MKPKQNPHYLGHRKRLKEKFLKDSSNFPDYEVLELLLFSSHNRKDVKPLAKKLLSEFGSINSILQADSETLKNFTDVNENVLVSLKLIKEIISRSSKQKVVGKDIISNWDQLSDYCKTIMKDLKQEQFRVLFLDKKHQLIADELVESGSIEQVEIDVRKLVKKSLNLLAFSVILVHNHPNLDSKPSKADIINTKAIISALKTVEIIVYDHLIIGKDGDLFSFKAEGLL